MSFSSTVNKEEHISEKAHLWIVSKPAVCIYSRQAGLFPSILRAVPTWQAASCTRIVHGRLCGCGGEPGASSVQPGQLRGSGLHVELGAASSIQGDGVYPAAARAVVGPSHLHDLNFNFSTSLLSWLIGRAWTEVNDSGKECDVVITVETCMNWTLCYCFQTRTVWIHLDRFFFRKN